MRQADKAWRDHYGEDDPDAIYLDGQQFGKRNHVGNDKLRHYVYEVQGWSDDEIETWEEDGDLYVRTPNHDDT